MVEYLNGWNMPRIMSSQVPFIWMLSALGNFSRLRYQHSCFSKKLLLSTNKIQNKDKKQAQFKIPNDIKLLSHQIVLLKTIHLYSYCGTKPLDPTGIYSCQKCLDPTGVYGCLDPTGVYCVPKTSGRATREPHVYDDQRMQE